MAESPETGQDPTTGQGTAPEILAPVAGEGPAGLTPAQLVHHHRPGERPATGDAEQQIDGVAVGQLRGPGRNRVQNHAAERSGLRSMAWRRRPPPFGSYIVTVRRATFCSRFIPLYGPTDSLCQQAVLDYVDSSPK